MKIVSCRPTITRKDLENVLDRLISEDLAAGSAVRAFESSIAELTGLKYSLAVTSLTAAYHLVFLALGLKGGDEVILPSFFYPEPLSVLSSAGAKPVLVDCDTDSPFMQQDEIRKKISQNTKAVITGHLFGFHPDPECMKEYDIPVIEDISHSFGTGAPGTTASFTVASFSPSMIITTGNGGAVLTRSAKYFSVMKDLQGTGKSSVHYDYAMTDFQAAMGLSQLSKLGEFIRRRRGIAQTYHDALRITPHRALMNYDENSAYQSFPILFDAPAEKTEQFFKKGGIEIIRPLERPLHAILGFPAAEFPRSERLAKKIFSPPIYPALSKSEIEKISKTIAQFI